MFGRILAFAAIAMFTLAASADPLNILFLSKSAGFQHSTIAHKEGEQSHTDKVLTELAGKMGAKVECTKDAGKINAENLKQYNVVIFYTTGDLTTEGTDRQPPMGADGVKDLVAWIQNGGGFMGFHCASDTFHTTTDTPTPYTEMIGGEFKTHGPQFKGKLKIVSPNHPAFKAIPDNLEIVDEWYMFKNLNTSKIHVLALLDCADSRADMYKVAPYPIAWCTGNGKGRVFYNAMGHREDVWSNATFQQCVTDAIKWAGGAGALDADPNFDKVVPLAK